jgi:hypothetical protein
VTRRISSIIDNGKKIFDTVEKFFDDILYQSPGIVGVYNTVRTAKSTYGADIKKDYTILRDDIGNIRDIVFQNKRAQRQEQRQPEQNSSNQEQAYTQSSNMQANYQQSAPIQSSNASLSAVLLNNDQVTTINASDKSILPQNMQKYQENMIYTKEYLNKVISLKNKSRNSSLERITERLMEIDNNTDKHGLNSNFNNIISIRSIDSILYEAMNLKTNNPLYADIDRINYDNRLATKDMKQEILNLYQDERITLKEATRQFEQKYGMHISSSTLSKYAREKLKDQGKNVKKRREAILLSKENLDIQKKYDSENYNS